MSAASKTAKTAPATPPIPEQGKEVAEPKLQSYFRLRKITGFLYEIIEVQVDETKIVPKAVGKQDLREILMVKLENLMNDRLRENSAKKAAK